MEANQLGRADEGTDPNTASESEMLIVIHPFDTWPSGESKEDLIRRMKARLAELPGYEFSVSQPILDSIKDNIFEPHSQLAARIYGDDFNQLPRIGNNVPTVLKTSPGATESTDDQ